MNNLSIIIDKRLIGISNEKITNFLLIFLRNEFQNLPEWLNEDNSSLERLVADHNRITILPNK